MTHRAQQLPISILGAAGLVLIAMLAPVLSDVRIGEYFEDPIRSLSTMLLAALLTAAFVLSPLWAGGKSWFAPRLVVGTYFILLFLGAAAIGALRLFAELGYPIAATQRLPSVPQTLHAVELGAIGGSCLAAGSLVSLMSTFVSRPHPATSRDAAAHEEHARSWAVYRRAAPYLIALGLVGCAVITASTGRIPLFSQNIDALRFSQGSGLGFASLLQYELLLVACLATAGLVLDRRGRRVWGLYLPAALLALVVFRVERSPFIIVFFVLLVTLVFSGRSISPVAVAALGAIVLTVVVGMGLVRLASSSALDDKREAVVRPLFDVAPELREQAFVYEIYPALHGFSASRDAAAIASSVVPGRLLALVGLDKAAVYTDVSRDYSVTMRQLGYYPRNEKPLRIGLIGELYADFGVRGIVLGTFGFGLLVGLIPLRPGIYPRRLVPVVLLAVLATMLLITPPPALLPIALMLLAPLAILNRAIVKP
jgi:hypothetical protein